MRRVLWAAVAVLACAPRAALSVETCHCPSPSSCCTAGSGPQNNQNPEMTTRYNINWRALDHYVGGGSGGSGDAGGFPTTDRGAELPMTINVPPGSSGPNRPGGGGPTPPPAAAPGARDPAATGLGGAGGAMLDVAAGGAATSGPGAPNSAARAAASNGARAVGSNVNWSPADLAKLSSTSGGEAAAAEAGYRAAAMLSQPRAASASAAPVVGPHDDYLGRRVADLSGGRSAPGSGSGAKDLLASALNKIKMGDYRDALNDALKAIAEDPANPEGYLRAAQAYNHLGDFASAEKAAREALQRNPNDAEAWKNLAWAQLKQGKYADALQSALAAVSLKPTMAEAWAIAAYAAERLGDKAASLKYIAKAAELSPEFVPKLQAAQAGRAIAADESADEFEDSLFASEGRRSQGSSGIPPLAAAGGGAAALALLGLGVWAWRRRAARAAQAAGIQLTP